MRRSARRGAMAAAMLLLLSGCVYAPTPVYSYDPYDPGQRAVGGAVLGAGTGAAIGAITGGGEGAAIGAVAGGALGALGGAATTPTPPAYAAPAPGYYGYAAPPEAY